ncbi:MULTISPECIES: ASCH domain-containing protein [Leptospira]|uniref:ASCH domain-containing protein n=2 Tax=Leptospira TaxID=171 RepID=A0AAW5V9J0_9LEPT|nr:MULTISPECIES: ASCH domain-containing protein [Leptospira]MCW7503897.1 ASCH domain-containing protein [Leptospira paudalimensis]MCW7512106.1 ASCH domain-containing protein [Leptospira levettii]MCW7517155.1 ASCH domain-containing protein [Leptospira levettii]
MNAILSIKPEYAWAIMEGKKKVEFRKNIFKKKIKNVLIYSSSPDQRFIGYFSIKEIDIDSPNKLWKKYSKEGCISKEKFFLYYSNKVEGTSIIIEKVVRFRSPLEPKSIFKTFTPPQSFIYCEMDLSKLK